MAAVVDHDIKALSDLLSTTTRPSNVRYMIYMCLCFGIILKIYRAILSDYHNFLALGPGGTPSTFAGYLRVSYLRLFALKDPFQPPSLAQACYPTIGYLQSLPHRSSPRPEVAGIAPQRQINQKCCPRLHQAIRDALLSLVDAHPLYLQKGNSCFEKHGLALFMSASAQSPHPTLRHLNPTCANTGEICHLHATDSSMHLTLHPVDAALVIASGWGERHPLAGCHIHGRRLLPAGFVMVYTPTAETDIPTIMQIVKAAGWWVSGIDLGVGLEQKDFQRGIK